MGQNFFSDIHLHIVWHTGERTPLLTPRFELLAHRELQQKIVNMGGAFVHDIGGTETHVHLAVMIAPTIKISDFIGQLKGASSHEVNRQLGNDRVLQWQAGYGVVSFGAKDLEWV